MIYCTPEIILSDGNEDVRSLLAQARLSRIVIDEADACDRGHKSSAEAETSRRDLTAVPERLLALFSPSGATERRPAFTILSAHGGPLASIAARLQMGHAGRAIARFRSERERENLRYVVEPRRSLEATARAVAECVFHGEGASGEEKQRHAPALVFCRGPEDATKMAMKLALAVVNLGEAQASIGLILGRSCKTLDDISVHGRSGCGGRVACIVTASRAALDRSGDKEDDGDCSDNDSDGDGVTTAAASAGEPKVRFNAEEPPGGEKALHMMWGARELRVVIATSTLQRGVDLNPSPRAVFVDSAPLSLTELAQSWGRGGRDEKPALCVLFIEPPDAWCVRTVYLLASKILRSRHTHPNTQQQLTVTTRLLIPTCHERGKNSTRAEGRKCRSGRPASPTDRRIFSRG